ncbi:S-layer homology domain-containing protein [Cohnella xylanilytica]|uniref:S-layer homology domain-containing protein n=1 Tax=Cohnella xylanilytica TaxID=557555 RepID=A0A841U5Y9_9BACL|nr:DUF4350 domain-containing protein [Cohnella xylanilytica]MBB6693430.1 S-layer homology domain-containing protein [Cohnella xylanilytica]
MNAWIRKTKKTVSLALAASLALGLAYVGPGRTMAATDGGNVVISQVYGGGGNSGAPYKNDFIELYNPTGSDIEIGGWSVQYASATNSNWAATAIPDGSVIKSHGYFLVQEVAGTGAAAALPAPDAIGTLAMAATGGKVALVAGQSAITGKSSPEVVDFVGFGAANEYEGSGATGALSNTTAAIRKDGDGQINAGYGSSLDTDDNKTDFAVAAPTPRNSSVVEEPYQQGENPASALPVGKNIQLTGDVLTGFTSAAPAGATVRAYDADPASGGRLVDQDTAEADGSFSIAVPADSASVYVTAEETGKPESLALRIDAATALPVVTVGSYTLDSSGNGTLTGTAEVANAAITVYADEALATLIGSATAGSDKGFSVKITSGPDTVYVTQVLHTDNGRGLPSPAASAAKQDMSVQTIASVRAVDANGVPVIGGSVPVAVEGVVTIDNNVIGSGNSNFYLQDATGGINVYGGYAHGLTIAKGNKLRVTGTITNYNGLIELVPTEIALISASVALPAPKATSIADLNAFATAEPLEGQLVTAKATISAVAASGATAYNVTAKDPDNTSKSITIRVMNATGIDTPNVLAVGKTYTITGIVGQYDTSSPYTSGYQIFPRSIADIAATLSLNHTPIAQAYTGADVPIAATATAADSVKAFYRADSSAAYRELAMTTTNGTDYSASIPAADLAGLFGFQYYLAATGGGQTAYAGSSEAPYSVTLQADAAGPEIASYRPGNNETVESYNPTIGATAQDMSGVQSISLKVDGADVTSSAAVTTVSSSLPALRIEYVPSEALGLGAHQVSVTAIDKKGNTSSVNWTFTVAEPFSGGNHYRGTTHDHTQFSHDGSGTPAEAIASAKKYGFDWIAITDHSHDIDADLADKDTVMHGGQPERTGGEQWKEIKKQVEEGTVNGEFIAIPSFEMTSTIWGHSNVFGTDNFIDRLLSGKYYNTDYNKFYDWIKTYDNDVIGVFNHPDWPNTPYGNFAPYDEAADRGFSMIEVGNGSGKYTYSNTESKFYRALDMGWHLAPVYGEDNHDRTWGQTMKRTVVVAKDLTRESLYSSMKNMRVYMSEDPNFQLDLFANGAYMGSTVSGSTIKFKITGQDPVQENNKIPEYSYLPSTYAANDNVAKVEIISNGGKAIQTYTPSGNEINFTWEPEVKVGSQAWYVVKVTQKDGDRIYSAPVWSEAVAVDVKVTSLSITSGAVVAGTDATVQAEIGNYGLQDVQNVTVKMYEDTVDAAHLIGQASFPAIAAGKTVTAQAAWNAKTPGSHNVIAVIDPIEGDSPDDNRHSLPVTVKEPLGITVLIDASHKNENTTTDTGTYKDNFKIFTQLLREQGYTVKENKSSLTADLLSGAQILVISHPYADLTTSENQAVAAFVQGGGSLLLTEKSNYNVDPTVNNDLLQEIGSGIRVNHDGIFDDSPEGNFWGNQLYKFAVRLHITPNNSRITDRISTLEYYSGASLVGPNGSAITDTPSVKVLAWGNATTYQDNVSRASRVYHLASDTTTNGSTIPAIAVEQVGQGRVFVAGMNLFNDNQLDAADPLNGNNILALNSIDWLASREAKVLPIAEARKLPLDSPVVAEGTVTSAAGTFFDAFYMQDSTGGIMVYKEVPAGALALGDTVRVYGHIKYFENNKELEFDAFAVDVIKTGSTTPVEPRPITTKQATEEDYEGQLVRVKGKVVSIYDEYSYVINDGSGDALVFTDGYIVNQGTIPVPKLEAGDTLEAVGLTGKFSEGYRIRVRSTSELIGTKAEPEPDVPVAGVTLDKETLDLKVGDSGTLTATVTPENATDKSVVWSSSDEAVAKVADGVVTAVGAGEAVITAKAGNGAFSDTVKVTVTPKDSGEPTAASVAAAIASIPAPAKDAKKLTLPTVPSGFSVAIKSSSDTNVLKTDGTIKPPGSKKTVTVVLTVTRLFDGSTADTGEIKVEIPAKSSSGSGSGDGGSGNGNGNSNGNGNGNGNSNGNGNGKGNGNGNGNGSGSGSNNGRTVVVPADSLKDSGSGTAIVKVASDTNEVKLPSNAAELLSGSDLEVSGDNLAVRIPSALLKQLADKLGAEESKNGTIGLGLNPLVESEVQAAIGWNADAAKWEAKPAGFAYDLGLSIAAANGPSASLTELDQPITLRLKIADSARPNRVGLYRVADNGALEYVGGEVVNGELVVRIDRLAKYAVLEMTRKLDDLPLTHWAYEVVQELAVKGVVDGTSTSKFEPTRPITRAEFAALLVKALKLPGSGAPAAPFKDVPSDAWFAQAVSIAYGKGIAKGSPSGEFNPQGTITREEMAVMLMNAYRLTANAAPGTGGLDSFRDAASVASWAADSVKAAAGLGLVKGKDGGRFDPQGAATRAEAAQIIYNLLKNG